MEKCNNKKCCAELNGMCRQPLTMCKKHSEFIKIKEILDYAQEDAIKLIITWR